jgi:hypothetical protein
LENENKYSSNPDNSAITTTECTEFPLFQNVTKKHTHTAKRGQIPEDNKSLQYPYLLALAHK